MKTKMRYLITNSKWLLLLLTCTAMLSLLLIYMSDYKIRSTAAKHIYGDVAKIPYNKTALVLGTAKSIGKYSNPYYENRMQAAAELWQQGKAKYFLLSGDNSRVGYDEPSDMKNSLIALGIPAENIFLDYAGFRTYDSMIRCREIFSQTQVTIVSQRFHNERALYIAQQLGMDAIAYNAADVWQSRSMYWREKLARVKLFVDQIIDTQPRFLGKKEYIPSI